MSREWWGPARKEIQLMRQRLWINGQRENTEGSGRPLKRVSTLQKMEWELAQGNKEGIDIAGKQMESMLKWKGLQAMEDGVACTIQATQAGYNHGARGEGNLEQRIEAARRRWAEGKQERTEEGGRQKERGETRERTREGTEGEQQQGPAGGTTKPGKVPAKQEDRGERRRRMLQERKQRKKKGGQQGS